MNWNIKTLNSVTINDSKMSIKEKERHKKDTITEI